MIVDVFTYTLEDGVLTIEGEGAIEEDTIFSRKGTGKSEIIEFCKLYFHTLIFKHGITDISAFEKISNFHDCKSLQKVVFPNTLRSLGPDLFEGCKALHTIQLEPGASEAGALDFSMRSFEGTAIKYLEEDSLLYLGVRGNPHYYFMGCKDKELKSINIAEGTVQIANGACYEMKRLRKVRLPDTLVHIGVCAFTGTNIPYIYLPDNLNSHVFTFTDCELSAHTISAPWSLFDDLIDKNRLETRATDDYATIMFRRPGSTEIGAVFYPPCVPRD